jgi:hypothetical protein
MLEKIEIYFFMQNTIAAKKVIKIGPFSSQKKKDVSYSFR